MSLIDSLCLQKRHGQPGQNAAQPYNGQSLQLAIIMTLSTARFRHQSSPRKSASKHLRRVIIWGNGGPAQSSPSRRRRKGSSQFIRDSLHQQDRLSPKRLMQVCWLILQACVVCLLNVSPASMLKAVASLARGCDVEMLWTLRTSYGSTSMAKDPPSSSRVQ